MCKRLIQILTDIDEGKRINCPLIDTIKRTDYFTDKELIDAVTHGLISVHWNKIRKGISDGRTDN